MPNNKKERKRNSPKKKETQNEAQKKAAAVVVRSQFEAELQRKFGTPAIDAVITARAVRLSPPPAAAAAAAGISSSSSSTTDDVVCYHGSSAEHFEAGNTSEYVKITKAYTKLRKKYGAAKYDQARVDRMKQFLYDKENILLFLDPNCAKVVFALAVALYFSLSSEEIELFQSRRLAEEEANTTPSFELESLLLLGINIKYQIIPFFTGNTINPELLTKYGRDVQSNERGIIHCLYRETKDYCDCMVPHKEQAKNMDNLQQCHECGRFSAKKLTTKCKGCQFAIYCGEQCRRAHWSTHREYCKKEQRVVTHLNQNGGVIMGEVAITMKK